MNKKAPWLQAFPKQQLIFTKKKKWIRRVSKKRRFSNAIYGEKRRLFLARHPKCQACKFSSTDNFSNQVHHRNGRTGPNFLDENTWIATCSECHQKIHNNPAWAFKNGLLCSRLAKAQRNQ